MSTPMTYVRCPRCQRMLTFLAKPRLCEDCLRRTWRWRIRARLRRLGFNVALPTR